MNKIFRKEVLIGLTVIIAMAILFTGINFLKGSNVFTPSNHYYAQFTNVAGLAKSAPVTINGFKVGIVNNISINYEKPSVVDVELSLDDNLKLPVGTKAMLASDLLGTATVALELAQNDQFHKIGDMIVGEVAKGMMDNVSNDLLPAVSGVFPKVDSLLTSLNRLVSDDAVAASVKRLDAITANLEVTTRQLNSLMSSMAPIASNIETITGNLSTASADVTSMTGQLSQVQLDSIAGNLQVLTENLREISNQINSPESSLGLLTRDPQLYNNLNSAMADLDSLFIDIKKNPKRYINIKLL